MDNSEEMTDRDKRIAKKAMNRASDWLRNAEIALQEQRWNDVVYSGQMAAEQSMKALLIYFGVSYKRVHDIRIPFGMLSNKEQVSKDFASQIPKYAEWLIQLNQERQLAGYGFEADVEEDHFKEFAPIAFQRSKEIHNVCENELRRLLGRGKRN